MKRSFEVASLGRIVRCGAMLLLLQCLPIGVATVRATQSVGPECGAQVRTNAITQLGLASYYGARYHGRRTASGEIFDMTKLTAAHPRYPFGTMVKVTHVKNNRSVVVRINDRGPFAAGRVIDLSQAAAEELQMVQRGLAEVRLEVLPR